MEDKPLTKQEHYTTKPTNGKMLNLAELADYLDVSKDKVRELVKQGLPHADLGYRTKRFNKTEVLVWLQSRPQSGSFLPAGQQAADTASPQPTEVSAATYGEAQHG